jgi:hypothetical protein
MAIPLFTEETGEREKEAEKIVVLPGVGKT